MIKHTDITSQELWRKLKSKEINFAGNNKLRIYGTLQCGSGKRMKKENRVFFRSEQEAVKNNFRACGHCMQNEYRKWKIGLLISSKKI